MRAFGWLLGVAMRHRWLTIAAALVAFGASIYGMGFVQQQFFPASNRPELLVTMSLPKNASIAATEAETERLEKTLAGDPDIARFSSYVGGGAIRFYLPLDVQLDNDFMAEIVVVAKDLEARDRVQARLETLFADSFPDVTARISRLELGPPVGWPVQYPRERADDRRGAGTMPIRSRRSCARPASCATSTTTGPRRTRQLRIVVDQDRVRQAGPQLRTARPDAQSRDHRLDGHAGPRFDLSRRRRSAGRERRAVEHRGPAQPPDHDADGRLGAPARTRKIPLRAR